MPKAALALVETGALEEQSFEGLFAATTDPTVIVHARCGSVLSANAAAARLLGIPRDALAGVPLPALLDTSSAAVLWDGLEAVREEGFARIDAVRFRGSDVDLTVRLSLVRSGTASYVLAHFAGNGVDIAVRSLVYDAIDSGAMMLAVTDSDLNVLYANRACLRLLEVESIQDVCGRPLSGWIEVSPADRERLRVQMAAREIGSVVPATHIARRQGLSALALAVPDESRSLWALILSERSRIN
jgi:PAS domain-containing protein